MAVLLYAAGLFALVLAIHVAWWRIKVPRQQLAALLGIILTSAAVGFTVLALVGQTRDGLPLPRLVLSIMLFGSFGVVYLILFTALEADSPTLTILGLIASAGERGIHREELARAMGQHSYVRVRVDQMIADRMAIETPTGMRLGTHGLWLSSLVLLYRRLLGRTYAGG
jgi:hypothetical protein